MQRDAELLRRALDEEGSSVLLLCVGNVGAAHLTRKSNVTILTLGRMMSSA